MVPNCHFSPMTSHTSTPCGSVGTFAPQGSSQVEKDLLRAKVHEALAVLVLACILTQAIFLLDVGCGCCGNYGSFRWEKFRLGMVRGEV